MNFNNSNPPYNPMNYSNTSNNMNGSSNIGVGFGIGSAVGGGYTGTSSSMFGGGVGLGTDFGAAVGAGGGMMNQNQSTLTQPQPVSMPNNHNSLGNANSGGVKSNGLLPKPILDQIDHLIDRLNAASGYKTTTATSASASNGRTNKNDRSALLPPPVRIICIGTNEGVPLSRSYGSNPALNNHLSEETLCSLETQWNTLPSSIAPHVMTTSIAHQQQQQKQQPDDSKDASTSYQPPHPLLNHIGMGSILRTTTIYYDNCVFIQSHLSPLVITIITSPPTSSSISSATISSSSPSSTSSPYNNTTNNVNVGYIKSFALPVLKQLLEPIRQLVLKRRIELSMVLSSSNGNGVVVGGVGDGANAGHHQSMVGRSVAGTDNGGLGIRPGNGVGVVGSVVGNSNPANDGYSYGNVGGGYR